MNQNIRESNFEALRILAMFMIVMFHSYYHTSIDLNSALFNFNTFGLQFISPFGKIGVNLFVLITGYFMVKNVFSWRRIIYLYFLILFYSITTFSVFCSFGNPSGWTLTKSLFPLTLNTYWFMTVYMILCLVAPFINRFLLQPKMQTQHLTLLIILLVIWSAIPTILNQDVFYYNELGWFITLYLIGAYFRLYSPRVFNNRFRNLIILIACFILLAGFLALYDTIGVYFKKYFVTYNMNSVLILLISIFIFQLFRQWKLKYTPWINQIAASTLAVYLIHDHPLTQAFLWKELFDNGPYFTSPWLFFYLLSASLIVFISSVLIDKIRCYLVTKPLKKVLDFYK